MQQSARIIAHQPDDILQGKQSGVIKCGQRRGKRGFQPDNAVRGFLEIRFFFCGMRRMVGDDTVDRAVQNARLDCLNVIRRAERRVHAVIGIAAEKQLVGQHKIMRGCFT